MVALVAIVRVILILLIVRIVLRGLFGARSRVRVGAAPPPPPQKSERVGGVLVRDPQCGTYVPQARALVVAGAGGPLHFCSVACRDAWAAAHRA